MSTLEVFSAVAFVVKISNAMDVFVIEVVSRAKSTGAGPATAASQPNAIDGVDESQPAAACADPMASG